MSNGCTYLPPIVISDKLEKVSNCLSYTKEIKQFLKNRTQKGGLVYMGQSLEMSQHK